MKQYYLISSYYINNYKYLFHYDDVIKILKEKNLNYTYNGYSSNIDKIIGDIKFSNIINIINQNKENEILSQENKFYPQVFQSNYLMIKEGKDAICPFKFSKKKLEKINDKDFFNLFID